MRILPLIAIALLFSFPASSFTDNYKVLGNYKELDYLVEGVDENSVGVTEKDLERTVKLRLMKNGIKPITKTGTEHYLYLNVNTVDINVGGRTVGAAARIDVLLKRNSRFYVSPDHGASSDHLPTFLVLQNSGTLL